MKIISQVLQHSDLKGFKKRSYSSPRNENLLQRQKAIDNWPSIGESRVPILEASLTPFIGTHRFREPCFLLIVSQKSVRRIDEKRLD